MAQTFLSLPATALAALMLTTPPAAAEQNFAFTGVWTCHEELFSGSDRTGFGPAFQRIWTPQGEMAADGTLLPFSYVTYMPGPNSYDIGLADGDGYGLNMRSPDELQEFWPLNQRSYLCHR